MPAEVIIPSDGVTAPLLMLLSWLLAAALLVVAVGFALVAKRFMIASRAGEFDKSAAQLGIVFAALILIFSASEIVLAVQYL